MATEILQRYVVSDQKSKLSAWISMGYALVSYVIGVGALFWLFLASAGWIPYGIAAGKVSSVWQVVLTDVALVVIFAVQHTVMARKRFKAWVTQFISPVVERSTFVLMSGVAMLMLIGGWQSLPGVVWHIQDETLRTFIQVLSVLGMAYVVSTSFITGHFELFGLKQPYVNLVGSKPKQETFKRKWFYTYSRHPMMLGLLFVFWATPDMSVTRFLLAALLTGYLFMGIRFEENSLIAEFGDTYRKYRYEVGLFFTFKK